MSEEPVDHVESADADATVGTAEPDRVHTGVVGVDEVIAEVAALHSRPLDEHVAVFEDAHERLRRALDDTQADSRADTRPEPA